MESYFHFLLHWRKITIGLDYEWLTNYLSLFKAYVHPVVDFDNLEMLDFCTPNIEKSSREKYYFEFPPYFQLESPNDVAKVNMVFWKK